MAIEVNAVAVVVGAIVVIGAAFMDDRPRSMPMRSCICSQPRPSRTHSTTWSAPTTPSGNQAGTRSGSSTNGVMTLHVHAPS